MEGPATRIPCKAANQSPMRLLILANLRSLKKNKGQAKGHRNACSSGRVAGAAFYVFGMSTQDVPYAWLRSSSFLRRISNVARRLLLCELQQGLHPLRLLTPVIMHRGTVLGWKSAPTPHSPQNKACVESTYPQMP